MIRSPLVTIAVRFGVIAGIMAVALLIGLFYMGRHPLMIAPYFDFRIFLFGTFIFFTLKEFRDYVQHGELYFWQGMAGALIVVTLTSLIGAIGVYVFGSFEPDFLKEYVDKMLAYLKTFSEDDIKAIGKSAFDSNYKTLPSTTMAELMGDYFLKGLFIGLFISIIMSIILRRIPKN